MNKKDKKPTIFDDIQPIKPNEEFDKVINNFATGLGIGIGLFLGMIVNRKPESKGKSRRLRRSPLKREKTELITDQEQ